MTKFFLITKRPITLVELLIGIVLTVSILMTLTFFYRMVSDLGYETDRVEAENFNMRHIESRLAKILPRAVSQTHQDRDFLFFSVGDEGLTKPGSQSLIFTFDNYMSLDKVFSGHALARLYLDKSGNLMIAFWPSPKRWEPNETPPMRKEMLLQNVENIAFEFYIAPAQKEKTSQPSKNENPPQENPPQKDQQQTKNKEEEKTKKAVEPEPKGDWRRQAWLQDYNQLPVMVKMIVTMPKGQKPYVFIFPLANFKDHIVYE